MLKTEVKSVLKRQFYGFGQASHNFFVSREIPNDFKLIAADYVACLELNYMPNGNFSVSCCVIKDKEMKFQNKLKTFYSGIDALVCYEGWISDVMDKFNA
jgi:hypothetical protein